MEINENKTKCMVANNYEQTVNKTFIQVSSYFGTEVTITTYPLTRHPIEGQGLTVSGHTSTCPQTEMKDHPACLRVTCQHARPPAFVGFLDQDCRYKSVTTQILRGGLLASAHSIRI